ncbi:MAG: hypothetical protein CM1200mP29_10330 [Verrucomicrobiota bacterium]|nr:MAG: hypothetical protein CM1200mP29_10330 [Verrucomicrobiota bacterium]
MATMAHATGEPRLVLMLALDIDMKIASGLVARSRMPLRRMCNRFNSRRSIDCSCLTNSAILPSVSIVSNSTIRLMERLMF